jgi:hypothetical protein
MPCAACSAMYALSRLSWMPCNTHTHACTAYTCQWADSGCPDIHLPRPTPAIDPQHPCRPPSRACAATPPPPLAPLPTFLLIFASPLRREPWQMYSATVAWACQRPAATGGRGARGHGQGRLGASGTGVERQWGPAAALSHGPAAGQVASTVRSSCAAGASPRCRVGGPGALVPRRGAAAMQPPAWRGRIAFVHPRGDTSRQRGRTSGAVMMP